jgi:hypothetical protein
VTVSMREVDPYCLAKENARFLFRAGRVLIESGFPKERDSDSTC